MIRLWEEPREAALEADRHRTERPGSGSDPDGSSGHGGRPGSAAADSSWRD